MKNSSVVLTRLSHVLFAACQDIGRFLKDKVAAYFSEKGRKKVDLKYIDPTYMIRAVETNTSDKIYCYVLAQGAVHAAFAGKTATSTLPTSLSLSLSRALSSCLVR